MGAVSPGQVELPLLPGYLDLEQLLIHKDTVQTSTHTEMFWFHPGKTNVPSGVLFIFVRK